MPLKEQKKALVKLLVYSSFVYLAAKVKRNLSNSRKVPVRVTSRLPKPSNEHQSGFFSAMSYNIAGLPGIISQAITDRKSSTALIGNKINEYDIVNVQEDFNFHAALYDEGNKHPYRTVTKGPALWGDGLNTLSRFPIYELKRVPWRHCTASNCFTPKGFSYCRIGLAKEVFIDLYNVHANAYEDAKSAYARRLNMRQLLAFIQANSEGEAVLVMGDMNSSYSDPRDNVKELVKKAGLTDTWIELMNGNQLPEILESIKYLPLLDIDHLSESIDKIFYRSSRKIKLKPSNYRIEGKKFTDGNRLPLSDHLPVAVDFEWKLT
ncbi:endonuclease/exonuclease/phosphatase family protein [Olivibacter sitiensis]|uniref:endonuclease/exonuclease/phosphatase family protein n=1 Tax=Olivibacter sitiensis TaxID=376470 RepID=UPI0004055090|nr:endonuclease/exonuclease/phosphatase family protein [Olivibacter sitiensis]